LISEGEQRRAAASARFAEAREARRQGRADAEELGRSALALYASALNWSEDTSEFEPIHEEMHAAGRWVRETFGCWLYQDERGYEERCPVALAHTRAGFSIEYVTKSIRCSVCGRQLETCDHIVGRVYGGQPCYRIIEEIDEVLGVALVSRPAQPDARIISMSIEVADLREALPDSWQPGMPVSCDKCVLPCPGIRELDLSEIREESAEYTPDSKRAHGQERLV
jgi:hypothetical protein